MSSGRRTVADASAVRDLPWVDEHSVEIAAPPDVVWRSLVEVLPRAFRGRAGEAIARLLGCEDVRSSRTPLEDGSRFTGFRVVRADPARELIVAGAHRFSRYAIVWRLEELDGGRTRLSGITRAAFPGVKGTVYRSIVIGTRGHVVVMRRLLHAVRRFAEKRTES